MLHSSVRQVLAQVILLWKSQYNFPLDFTFYPCQHSRQNHLDETLFTPLNRTKAETTCVMHVTLNSERQDGTSLQVVVEAIF